MPIEQTQLHFDCFELRNVAKVQQARSCGSSSNGQSLLSIRSLSPYCEPSTTVREKVYVKSLRRSTDELMRGEVK
jgi:hypothetical protein